jgi:hypothetical protein
LGVPPRVFHFSGVPNYREVAFSYRYYYRHIRKGRGEAVPFGLSNPYRSGVDNRISRGRSRTVRALITFLRAYLRKIP